MLTSYDDTNATAQHTPTSNTKIVIITSRVYILYDNNLKPDRASRSIISRVMARHRDDVAQIRLPRGAEFRTVAVSYIRLLQIKEKPLRPVPPEQRDSVWTRPISNIIRV